MSDAHLVLRNGVRIPVLGLGVYEVPKKETEAIVLSAFEAGYRLIDTAALYENEREVGKAIEKSGIPRPEIFVTTKLHPARIFGVEQAFYASLNALRLDYIDLYLIHWPFLRTFQLWKSIEKLYAEGLIKAIGVSNFRIKDIDSLSASASVIPMVNQVEFHPFLYRRALLSYCAAKQIVLEAHSPLTHGKRIGDQKIGAIAMAYSKSPAQILIRWAIQHGVVAIPKTRHADRLAENAAVFDFAIRDKDMAILDGLNENYHVAGLSKIVGDES